MTSQLAERLGIDTEHRPIDLFGVTVSSDLVQSENTIDLLMAQLGQGLTNLADGRRVNHVRAHIGQKALESYGHAINGLIAVRGHVIDTHGRLARDARREGIHWQVVAGPTESTPDDQTPDSPYPKGG